MKSGNFSHMHFLRLPVLVAFLLASASGSLSSASLPMSKTFIGIDRWEALMDTAYKNGWSRLPLGERTARIGLALRGTDYKNYTLELDERKEAPSVNMHGMDCWTFFEISLASARLLKEKKPPYRPQDMLKMIEIDRYRSGKCDGKFTSRLHHLEDWAYDNERRGLVKDVTRSLGGVPLKRRMRYMGEAWKNFRQLRADRSLIPFMKKVEAEISRRGIYYIPKNKVRSIESKIRNGDVISIVTTWPGTYTSHVGLAYRDSSGTLRFLHASRDKDAVTLDARLSDYLARYSKHAGIMVTRPQEL